MMSDKFLLIPCFIEIHVFNANIVDPDQGPHSAVSDLGLRCFLMSLLSEARFKCVNDQVSYRALSFHSSLQKLIIVNRIHVTMKVPA